MDRNCLIMNELRGLKNLFVLCLAVFLDDSEAGRGARAIKRSVPHHL